MKYILTMLFLCSSIDAFEVGKNDVSSMIDQMVTKGIITKEDGQKAKSQMGSLSNEQWSDVNTKGRMLASKYTGSDKKVDLSVDSASDYIDFDSKEFKDIQATMNEVLKP